MEGQHTTRKASGVTAADLAKALELLQLAASRELDTKPVTTNTSCTEQIFMK